LPGAHSGVWNEAALKVSSEIILCESLIDALTFWCAGYRNVTASYGIEGFTADHLAAFKQNNIERVLIAYDRDPAGNHAAEKLAKQLIESGIDCYRIQFPKGMDANEYARQVTPAGKSLGVAIRSAQWLSAGKEPTRKVSNQVPDLNLQTTEQAAKKEKQSNNIESSNDNAEICDQSNNTPPLAAEGQASEQPLPASPVPETPKPVIDAEIKTLGDAEELIINLGDRRYRIRGLDKNLNYDQLKINLLVSRPSFDGVGDAVHVDTLDCYQSRPRSVFIKQAAIELGLKEDIIKHDLGKILLKLESLQEQRLQSLQEPKTKTTSLTDEDTQAALALLKSPDLLNHIQNDFNRCGVVGEDTNKLVGYLAVISRKLEAPLAITIQSTSAAGKSALMDAVLAFMPAEERIKYSAMTGQSLFYMGETDLQHKVLAIVEEEGASNAAYALKLLQSEGELTIASTGKDPVTGELKTQDYQVKGPVMIMLTTTAIDVDEELLNRCIVLSVDEGREQTQAIHAIQRDKRTLQGLLAKNNKQAIVTLHQNAQRLLQPLAVVNPYAKHLSFINDRTRTRRDHEKYLTLIDSLALLHQHQRDIKTITYNNQPIRYIEVSLDDIETANQLAHEVLGRTLDELPPQSRKLLGLIVEWVAHQCTAQAISRSDYRFSRREIREHMNWSDTALKVHLKRLEELEYLLVHRGGRGQSYVYELLYQSEGKQGEPFLMGLIDVKKLRYDVNKSGQNTNRSGVGQPLVSPQSGAGQGAKNTRKANKDKAFSDPDQENTKTALLQPNKSNGSYRSHNSPVMIAKAAD
jgi:hypothetical protein